MNNMYVAGFQIHPDLNLVTLVQKRKPDWQAGLLNGVGGQIERLCHCGHVESIHKQNVTGTPCLWCQANKHMITTPCANFAFDTFETPLNAMKREYQEETGRLINEWNFFCQLSGQTKARAPLLPNQNFTVYFYRHLTRNLADMGPRAGHETSEPIMIEQISNVTPDRAIANLPWLLQMATWKQFDKATHFTITENYH